MKRRSLIISLVAIVVISVGGVIATLVTDTKPQLGLDLQGGASVTLQPVGQGRSGSAHRRHRHPPQPHRQPRRRRAGDHPPGQHRDREPARRQGPGPGHPARGPDRQGALPARCCPRPRPPAVAAAAASTTTTPSPGSASSTPDASATTRRPVAPPWPRRRATGSSTDRRGDARRRPRRRRWRPRSRRARSRLATRTPPDATVVLPGRGGQTIYELGPAFALGEDAIVDRRGRRAERPVGGRPQAQGRRQGPRGVEHLASKCYSQEADCPTRRHGHRARRHGASPRRCPRPRSSPTPTSRSRAAATFKKSEAKDLALVLKYGALPVELKPQAVQTVSATLGKDSLHAGLIAGFVGVAARAALHVLYYRALGHLVVVGLFLVSAACCGRSISLPRRRRRAGPHPGRRHRHHRVGRRHRRLLRRVLRATEGRGPLGQVAAGVGAQRASPARGARSSPPTSCR